MSFESGWPADGKINIKTLAQGSTANTATITSVKLLGSAAKLKWTRGHDGLNIELPATKTGEYAWAFRIERSSR